MVSLTVDATEQAKRITKARTFLLLDNPWFGSLALRLRVEVDEGGRETTTMATDGTRLLYSPSWVEGLDDKEIMAVVAHEVLHCALRHMYRIGTRDFPRWNTACDYAINPMLVTAGFELPAGCLLDPQYAGMAAEQIYARLPLDQKSDRPQPDFLRPKGNKKSPGDGEIGTQPGDAPDDQKPGAGQGPSNSGADDGEMSETDWEVATEQATLVSNKAGKAPAEIVRKIQQARKPVVDWRTILRRFVEHVVPSDYSWSNPNRRYISTGLYLPGTVKENTPRLGVAIDTSGSIDGAALSAFASELTAIMYESRPAAIDVIYCDSSVHGPVETFEPDGGPVKLTPRGGGGTAFQPALDWFTARSSSDEAPAAVIYFTDLYGPAPKEPGFPVLWITGERSREKPAFGEHVQIAGLTL